MLQLISLPRAKPSAVQASSNLRADAGAKPSGTAGVIE
jgi:hypothetical protein